MTIQKINYGLAPDDGTGDKLRDAFRKTDDNFTELGTRKANAQDVVDALAFKADTATVDTELAKKADIASPALTGTPTAPTASAATNTTQLATTAFVQTAVETRVASSEKGAASGVATLDATGKVPAVQLPSYVDDVLEYANLAAFPAIGESGKIYVAIDTNQTYRWSGSAYIHITSGAVDSVAGKTGVVTLVKADVGLSNVDNTADSDKPVSIAQQAALDTKVDKVANQRLMTAAEATKLAGIADQATKNATDAALRDRSTHTGEQSIATVAGLPVVLPLLVKVDPSLPCLAKTSATTLAIKAGTHVKIGNAYVSLTVQTAVVMPAVMTPGEDYAVFVHPDGTASAAADPFFAPAAAPVPGSLKIGGFHYGLTAPGSTPASGGFATTGFTNTGGNYQWTQARVDRIAGINEFSIWDLMHRSKGEQRGFAFDPARKVWVAIYFCSPDHITDGISRYNTPVASGTVLPKIPVGDDYCGDGVMTYGRLSAYEAVEILSCHGCRLITEDEFISAAFGVTENQSLGGAASTIPATKREPGYTSRIGLEQATGHIWTIGGPLTSVGGSAWTAGPNRGNFYGGAGLPLFGGARGNAADSGSRASSWGNVFWRSDWSVGLRAACDHLSA